MKKTLFICITLISLFSVKAQLRLEGQLGGANFWGYTTNIEGLKPLNKAHTHNLGIKLGVGALLPGWASEPTVIIHSGLNYYFKNWGVGGEVSGFAINPFANTYYGATPDLSMLVYPNASYTFKLKKSNYLKVSAGVFLAYERYYSEFNASKMEFAGDPIPGISICFGSEFFEKE